MKSSKFPKIIVQGTANLTFKRGVRKAAETVGKNYRRFMNQRDWSACERAAEKGWCTALLGKKARTGVITKTIPVQGGYYEVGHLDPDGKSEYVMKTSHLVDLIGSRILDNLDLKAKSYIPMVDFVVQVTPHGKVINVEVRELEFESTPDGRAYYSPSRPMVEVDGAEKVVSFSDHAVKRLAERLVVRPNTYRGMGDVFGLLTHEHDVTYKSECLAGVDAAFSVWRGAMLPFTSGLLALAVLGESPPPGTLVRMGYCPADVHNGLIRARSLLLPGMRGTPERDWYLLKHGDVAAADFDKRVETLEQNRQRGCLMSEDRVLLRELHDAFPQVIVPEAVGWELN